MTDTFYFYHDEFDSIQQSMMGDAFQNAVKLQAVINKYDVIVGHNLKFDVNNLRKAGFNFDGKQFFCTMVAHYILSHHQKIKRTLDACAGREGFELKDDRVKLMWQSGIDTAQIPLSILVPYCEHDANLTLKLSKRYLLRMQSRKLIKCFKVGMEFMGILSEMETNGIHFNVKKAHRLMGRYSKLSDVLQAKAELILTKYIHPALVKDFNLSSGPELSAALYGGAIKRKVKGPVIKTKNVKVKMPYVFTYKGGRTRIKCKLNEHPGTSVLRYVYQDKLFECKGLGIKPLRKSELAKTNGVWKLFRTDKDTMSNLKTTTKEQAKALKLLIKISKLKKMIETFKGKTKGSGLVNKIGTDGLLHTNYNQALTATGTLSSNDPNAQNMPRSGTSPIKTCFESRYPKMQVRMKDGSLFQSGIPINTVKTFAINKKDPKKRTAYTFFEDDSMVNTDQCEVI
jgi:DNA polymerase I-like protein with 3'-5' exonuclease and polymerase domains